MRATKINVSDLRDNLADYLDLVMVEKRSLDITRRGKVIAQIGPKVQSERNYTQAIKRAAGTFSSKNHPEWKNIDSIVKWVNQGRKRAERY